MSWFGGFVADSPKLPTPVPTTARTVRSAPFPLWVVGDWPPAQLTVVPSATGYVAVFGVCAASTAQIAPLCRLLPDEVITRWPGAYVIVQATDDEVTVLTDVGAAIPIYTTSTRDGVAWASSSRALASLTGSGVDVAWLAATLNHPVSPGISLRSAFTDVSTVPAGHRLTLRPKQPPRSASAWRPHRTDPCTATHRLRQALHGGIAARTATARTPTSDLSGGMDSTAVCLLAAAHATNPVTAVTIHPAGTTTGGDVDYARAAAAHRPDLRHVLLPLDASHTPYGEMDRVPATDEPAPSTITYARLAAQFAMLADLGSDIHITGDGGDTLFYPAPDYLPELARTGRILRLARHAQGYARLQQISPWPLLTDSFTCRQPTPTLPAWLTPEARALAAQARQVSPDRSHTRRTLINIQSIGRSARADAQLAETFGIRLHNPFTDGAVIDAALSVPAWQRGDPWKYKPLLAAALIDVLPEAVAHRDTKGAFGGDHYRGLRAHLSTVRDLTDGKLAELGLIDPRPLRQAIDTFAAGLPVAFAAIEAPLATEVWLRAITDAPNISWCTLLPQDSA